MASNKNENNQDSYGVGYSFRQSLNSFIYHHIILANLLHILATNRNKCKLGSNNGLERREKHEKLERKNGLSNQTQFCINPNFRYF